MVSNLAFFTDLTDYLNMLNLKLQSPKKITMMMYDNVKSFKCKFLLLAKQLRDDNLAHLTSWVIKQGWTTGLKRICRCNSKPVSSILSLFQKFLALEKQLIFFTIRLAFDFDTISEEIQIVFVELLYNMKLKQKYAEVSVPDFKQFFPCERFSKLFSSSLRILAIYRSTCLWLVFLRDANLHYK